MVVNYLLMESLPNKLQLTLCVLAVFSVQFLLFSDGCNEAVCASIVSKCMLTQSCKCDAKNTSCSKDCFYCLDYFYTECCSCVEMCPRPNDTENSLSQKSHVEDLAEPYPDLFNVLTEEKDRLLRWTTYTYPVTLSFISLDKEVVVSTVTDNTVLESVPVNCTVAFMSQCMSFNKCKNSCSSMGASSYRWFHDGCCECIGATCLNYGMNESRCLQCPPDKEDMTAEEQEVLDKDTSEKVEEDVSNFVEEADDDDVEDSVETTNDTVDALKEKDDDDDVDTP